MIKDELVRLDDEDHKESVEPGLHQVEGGQGMPGDEAVEAVTQLTKENANNPCCHL